MSEVLERRRVTLFERTAGLRIVQEWLDEVDQDFAEDQTGEAPLGTVLQLLNEAKSDYREKAIHVALFVQEQQEEAALLDRHIERLERRRDARKNTAKRLTQLLHTTMVATGQELIRDPLVTIRVQASPPAVVHSLSQEELREIAQREPMLVRVVPEKLELDARAVINRWKDTGEIPDVKIGIACGTHVRIR